ncbi:ABC transporter substrate-binding protein [Halanaerobium hydrogeniformans]|uniref:Periplasmic binding protein n=1 Tax=Halanaerobium hydrogeniformans TaxID=656519 RepID=E4RKB0_HALHG|nr:ABC transporter substrate-binding protein [Halanaerobium hydrogeniformans]ADQ15623.1 periplasmic binding protein [Halanaerobium hydrogeniformans]
MLEKFINKKKRLLIILIFIFFISIFSTNSYGRAITDLSGRELMIPDEIDEIIAVGPGALRLVVYLEADSMVIGIEEFERRDNNRPYNLARPELRELPVIGPQFGGDAELIAAAEPDLIIASYLSKTEADNLAAKTSLPVVLINDESAGSMSENELTAALNFLAPLLNKEDRAEELVNGYQEYKNDLINRAAEYDQSLKEKKLYIGGIGHRGAQGIRSTETNYLPFQYLGLENVFKQGDKSNIFISGEELLLRDPEIIFIDQGGIELVRNDLNRAEYSYLQAVANYNLYGVLPYNHYTTNFATVLADAYYIGQVIFGDDFIEEDPAEKADEIYQFFLGEKVYQDMAEIFGGFKNISFD